MRLVYLIGFCLLLHSVSCNSNSSLQPLPEGATPMDRAAHALSNITGSPVRAYSTRDFGREQFTDARSVVVSNHISREVLAKVRQQLEPGIIAFIGTTNWLGDEQHPECDEIVVAKAESQFDALRIAQSDAVNYDMMTEDLVSKLSAYDREFGIDIFHAETDTIEFCLKRLPEKMSAFCDDIYKFCPDTVEQGTGTVQALQAEILRTQQVYLWWD